MCAGQRVVLVDSVDLVDSNLNERQMRKSPRERRLLSDYRSVQKLMRESTIFSFEGRGSPPETYRFRFKGKGFCRRGADEVVVSHNHEMIVELGAAYPRMVPNLAWSSSIFHPNISHNGVVCLGGYGTNWVPSLTLSELCVMLWDMIRYENFDIESPYNREAALWAKTQKEFPFPIDRRSIRDRVVNAGSLSGAGPVPASGGIEIIEDGIEIIETGVEVVRRRQFKETGIVFKD